MKEIRKKHPRPQMIRSDWEVLDGIWSFKFDDKNTGLLNKWQHGLPEPIAIEVPFTYETELSGINDEIFHPVVWYQRTFSTDELSHYLLHFEGSDYQTQVWINGVKIGENQGAYHRFSFELDVNLTSENQLVVRVEDSMSPSQPRGKQRWLDDNFGCWYVQTTGIWKSVWLEKIPTSYITELKLTPIIDSQELACQIELNHYNHEQSFELRTKIHFENEFISS